MALRPLRSATITFGLVSIPVRFYTSTSSEDVHFNLLHGPCGSRVNRKWWCPTHEQMISSEEMVRAYQIDKGRYVTFTDEEIEALESDDNRALDISEFVSLEQVDPVYFEKAYFLGPGAGGGKTYQLLSTALRKQGKVALARWVSSNREHLVLIRPYDDGLVLHTMYYADEVRDFGAIEKEGGEIREKEVKLAEMLINELTEKTFDPLQYKDEYRQRLMDRIEAKASGQEVIVEQREEERVGEVVDIMEALRRSLEGAKGAPRGRKAPQRAREKAAAEKPAAKSPRKRRIS